MGILIEDVIAVVFTVLGSREHIGHLDAPGKPPGKEAL